MINPNEEELAELIEKMPKVSFKNEHGEKFILHSNGVMVFMSGDEVRDMIPPMSKINRTYINLFNDRFNIWHKKELYKLGKALQELSKK